MIDDTYLRTFGAGPKWIHIESQVSQCDAQCSAYPNMMWDKSAPGPGCTCVCEAGYESDDRGDCVACDQVCAAYDPRAVYDPTDSRPNRCGCTCSGDLMEFAWGESDGACRCIAGTESKGDDCVCKDGYTVSADGKSCVEQTPAEPEGNCPTGTNCLQNPGKCTCGSGTVCDALGEYTDPRTFCSPRIAYIFISSEVTSYEYLWITGKARAIRALYKDKGYTTRTIRVNGPSNLIEYLAPPATGAVAYFGHAVEPAVEDLPAATLANSVRGRLQQQYAALGIPPNDAQSLSNPSGQNLGLEYAYVHACHSADDMSLRDYLVGSGGTYWGHDGVLWATQTLTEYTRP